MTTRNEPPIWFWIVTVVFLLRGAMGCYACVLQIRLGAEAMGPGDDWSLKYYAALPAWYDGVSAVGTFGGSAGGLCCPSASGRHSSSGSRSPPSS